MIDSITPFDEKIQIDNCIRRNDVFIRRCENVEADTVFNNNYWMQRTRRSRRISYVAIYKGSKVAWIQCADPFGTKLAKPLQMFDINEALELCRGYFIDNTPSYIESCAIGKVLRIINNDWYNIFGIIKKLAIIYQDIDVKQKGIVYKALGFIPYAKCLRARHFSEPTRGDSRGTKILWARSFRPISGFHYKVNLPKSQFGIEEG